MSCFCMSNGQVAVAPMDEAVMKKSKNPTDMKAKAIEEHGHKEETHNEAVPHKTHKSTGGSQAHAFVRHLIHKADARSQLEQLLHENYLVSGGDENIKCFFREQGFNTGISNVIKALEHDKANDLMFWASSYNLFVTWSVNGQHPWDNVANASKPAATLEIGSLRGTNKTVVLINGQEIKDYTFASGIFRTTTPVVFDCPTGAAVPVNLELQMSSFSGYESAETSTYLGTQCHGVMWPETSALPAAWPIAPPIVSGKVNIASRDAAAIPAAIDNLAEFSGVYATVFLPAADGQAPRPVELTISSSKSGRPVVALNGNKVSGWTFDANNVLSFEHQAGYSAWLQFTVLPGGPLFIGTVVPSSAEGYVSNVEFQVFGEPKGQASRALPDGSMDNTMGQLAGVGMGAASAILFAHLLKGAALIWEELRKGASPDVIATEQDELLAGMEAAFRALKRLQKAADAFQAAFPLETDIKTMDPAASAEAVAAAATAANIALAGRLASEQVESAVAAAEDGFKDGNTLEATAKAAVAAWRSAQAGEAAGKAEAVALNAAQLSRAAHTKAALAAAISASQAYNQAKNMAIEAAKAQMRAANASLKAVEDGIQLHANNRDYGKLKETAEASGLAAKAVMSAQLAVEGWTANTIDSRAAAIEASKDASEASQLCHKFMRNMNTKA
ncbi:g10153 [Coccomyxa elongata]